MHDRHKWTRLHEGRKEPSKRKPGWIQPQISQGFKRLIYLLDLITLMIYPVIHCLYCEMMENAQDFPHVNNKTHPEWPTGSSTYDPITAGSTM